MGDGPVAVVGDQHGLVVPGVGVEWPSVAEHHRLPRAPVIRAGGIDKDVTFAEADPDLNDQIDAAYRDKYRRYGERIIGGVVNPRARAATIKLLPN
jgi:hypothetical protein